MSQLLALDGSPLPDPPPPRLDAAAPAVSIMLITEEEGQDFYDPATPFLPLLLTRSSLALLETLPPEVTMDWMAHTRRRFQQGDYGITAELDPEQAALNARARRAGMGRISAEYAGPEGDRMKILQALPAELMPILLAPNEVPQPSYPVRPPPIR